jgi:hypothetical protein
MQPLKYTIMAPAAWSQSKPEDGASGSNPKPARGKKQKSPKVSKGKKRAGSPNEQEPGSSEPKPKAPVLDLTFERLMAADTSLSEADRQLAKNMIAMSEKIHAVKLAQHAKALKAWQAKNVELLRPKYESTVKLYLACKYKVVHNESMLRTYTQKLNDDFEPIFDESDVGEEALAAYTKQEQERLTKKRTRDSGRKNEPSNKKAKTDDASGNDSDKSDDEAGLMLPISS